MKMTELCAGDRPREKLFSKGASALSDAELMAILLRTGTAGKNVVEIAQSILAEHNGKLSAVASLSIEELCGIKGLGKAKAATLYAAFETGRRSLCEKNSAVTAITTSEAAASAIMGHIKGLPHEECWAMFLNRSNRVISLDRISTGGMFETVIDNRIVSRMALEKRAAGIILFHNHPSGNPQPGQNDLKLTEKLKKALATFDISLIDHIVIGSDSYFSFADGCATPLINMR